MKKVISISILAIVIIISLFIGLLAYSSKKDVSAQEPYKTYINTPVIIKDSVAIVQSQINGRFKNNYLEKYFSGIDDEYITHKKILIPGDTLQFYAAKSYYSMHVDTNYYLLGRETLDSGEIIEFEYFLSDYEPKVWETLDEFLARKDRLNH